MFSKKATMKLALYNNTAKMCDSRPKAFGLRSKFNCLMTNLRKISNFWAFSGLV